MKHKMTRSRVYEHLAISYTLRLEILRRQFSQLRTILLRESWTLYEFVTMLSV